MYYYRIFGEKKEFDVAKGSKFNLVNKFGNVSSFVGPLLSII